MASSSEPIPKAAIITGAAQGIGRAIALRLAGDGYDIAANDLPSKSDELKEVVEAIQSKGRKAIFVTGDVSKEDDVQNIVDTAVRELGELRIMVANAAIGTPAAAVVDTSLDIWNLNLSINLTGTFLCYRAAARQLIKQGKGGRIVGACSGMGKRGAPNISPYSVTKFGIRGLTQSLASEVGKYGITVNAYAPGAIETALMRGADKSICAMSDLPEGTWVKAVTDRTPLGTTGTPEQIAGLVSYLVSDDADFMTGQSVSINGGTYYD
ncbi:hypothetical protein M422DRAFT_73183 [Sphaerobolus stellatus SS14]|nr:hypothetical protein M422DRAFT_73183 [Sphaerobolus stellatus SS14]